MKLTNSEKLILVMLADIQNKLGKEHELDGEFIKRAIFSDNTWALEWEYTGIFSGEPEEAPPEVNDVCNILDMWFFIESAYDEMDPDDKARIAEEVGPLGKNVRFLGFDGNYETKHLSVASFLINDMDRFQHFSGRDLNSHCPVVDGYLRMFEIFKTIRPQLAEAGLTADQITRLLNARKAE